MSISETILHVVNWSYLVLYLGVGICGFVAGVIVLLTREDAFEAAGRQSKGAWAAMLFGAGLVLVIPFGGLSFFAWGGAVVIGVYWFDVHPQIRDIINGNYHW